MTAADGWDAIVVGAGPAGCAVAAGLSATGRRVLLIEAGPGEPRPASVSGPDIIAASREPTRQWPGLTARSSPEARPHPYRQGRGLGGGSLINALLLSPGDRSDYRRWERDHRCTGWGPDEIEPWLASAAGRFPDRVSAPGPVTGGFAAAAAAAGHPMGGSSMEPDRLGVVEARLALDGTRRWSAVDAYLADPGGGSPTVLTGAPVSRVVMSGGRAEGVRLSDGTGFAAPLVVLCAGAIGTPTLLLASGLTERGVGRRLKDHPSFAFTLGLSDRAAGSAGERTVTRLLRWSSGPTEHGDLQAFVIDRVDDGGTTPPLAVVAVGLMRVGGAGFVGPDGEIVTGALAAADDRRRLSRGVRDVLRLLRSGAMGSLIDSIAIDDRGTPAERMEAMDETELGHWLADHPGPYAHPAASCPMGPESDPEAVTSCRPEDAGRLLGYRGLYAADASIMPDLIQGGLQLPVMAVAERVTAGLVVSGV